MPINEAFIRSIANAKSFARGQDYYDSEAVTDLEKRGDMLTAGVYGSQDEPYQVTILVKSGEFVSAHCDCPYDFDGECKHVVAVLLAYLHGEMVEKPALETLLAEVSREKLLALLTGILQQQPKLISWVESQLNKTAPSSQAPTQTLDMTYIKKQAQKIFAPQKRGRYNDYYDDEGEYDYINQAVEDWLSQISPMLEAGESHNALIMLEAIIQPFGEFVAEYDMGGEAIGVIELISEQMTEAILLGHFTAVERNRWKSMLKDWQQSWSDFADYLAVPLLAVSEEEVTAANAEHAHELNQIRLRMLARQGRTEEYLELAQREGHIAAYLAMLVQVGRAQEALAYPNMTSANEAWSLAQALYQHGQPQEALAVAERGLSFPEPYNLAKWLTEVAPPEGNMALALQAARIVFRKNLTLADFQRVKAFAGEQWAELKPELLKALAESTSYEKAKIYIAEGMAVEAIQEVTKSPYIDQAILSQLVDLATPTHPDWVIKLCHKQAEPIMDGGKSNSYQKAAEWLGKAKKAYLQANRQAEWRTYLEGVITKHRQKYALRPLLERLR